jgi:hypothetical protein
MRRQLAVNAQRATCSGPSAGENCDVFELKLRKRWSCVPARRVTVVGLCLCDASECRRGQEFELFRSSLHAMRRIRISDRAVATGAQRRILRGVDGADCSFEPLL